jgi:hypothetical protein
MVGERRRTLSVRWSETGERNDADGAFSTAGYGSSPSTVPTPFKWLMSPQVCRNQFPSS